MLDISIAVHHSAMKFDTASLWMVISLQRELQLSPASLKHAEAA